MSTLSASVQIDLLRVRRTPGRRAASERARLLGRVASVLGLILSAVAFFFFFVLRFFLFFLLPRLLGDHLVDGLHRAFAQLLEAVGDLAFEVPIQLFGRNVQKWILRSYHEGRNLRAKHEV